MLVIQLISSIGFVYLLRKSPRDFILPLLVLISRWNLIDCPNWIFPLIFYILLIFLFFFDKMSVDQVIFSLLYLISRPQNCFLIVVHMYFYRYLHVKDARLAFLLSQSAFFHLVRILIFNF